MKRLLPSLAVGLFVGLFHLFAAAHPFHTTFADAEHDRGVDRLEIAVKVAPEDLERALEERIGRSLDLDDPRERARIERSIAAYLREHVAVFDPRGHRRPMRYLGRETGAKEVWLYMEIAVPDVLVGHRIENTLFFELQTHQVNTLVLHFDGRRATYTFKPGRGSLPLDPRARRGAEAK